MQHDLSLQLLALLYKILNDICPSVVSFLRKAVDSSACPDLVQGDLDMSLHSKRGPAVGVLNQVLRVLLNCAVSIGLEWS